MYKNKIIYFTFVACMTLSQVCSVETESMERSPFSTIPREITKSILDYLSPSERLQVAPTCKTFYQANQDIIERECALLPSLVSKAFNSIASAQRSRELFSILEDFLTQASLCYQPFFKDKGCLRKIWTQENLGQFQAPVHTLVSPKLYDGVFSLEEIEAIMLYYRFEYSYITLDAYQKFAEVLENLEGFEEYYGRSYDRELMKMLETSLGKRSVFLKEHLLRYGKPKLCDEEYLPYMFLRFQYQKKNPASEGIPIFSLDSFLRLQYQ